MSDHIYRGKAQLMAALDGAIKKAQLEKVVASKGSDVELALNPATLEDMLEAVGLPGTHVAHDGKSNASYQGIPIRESELIPPGKAFIVDRGAQIRGVEPTEAIYDEAVLYDEPGQLAPGGDWSSLLRSGAARVSVRDAAGVMREVGKATVDTTAALNEFAEAALAVSGRMLPPPEWQDRAVRAAQAAGMDLEWCQQAPPATAGWSPGRVDTWARVTTRRGGFDVRPAPGESWTQALAAAGIDVPLDAVA